MSISDKLSQLSADISNAYEKVEEKGGTIPSDKNADNLASAIESIQGGSGEEILFTTDGRQYTKNVVVADNVTSIYSNCYYNLEIETITLTNNITSIGNSAFQTCQNLKYIYDFPNITRIEPSICNRCFSLINFKIPKSVTYIGATSFYLCNALEYLDMTEYEETDTLPTLANINAFTATNNPFPICVSSESVKTNLISMSNWSSLASRIRVGLPSEV